MPDVAETLGKKPDWYIWGMLFAAMLVMKTGEYKTKKNTNLAQNQKGTPNLQRAKYVNAVMSNKSTQQCSECGLEYMTYELVGGVCSSCRGDDPKKEWDDPNPMEKPNYERP